MLARVILLSAVYYKGMMKSKYPITEILGVDEVHTVNEYIEKYKDIRPDLTTESEAIQDCLLKQKSYVKNSNSPVVLIGVTHD